MSINRPIIEVKNLSKVYNIGHEQKSAPGTLTFRDSIMQTVRKPLEIFTGHKMKQEKFWALKDVNFEVNQGDIVGIIGRNGSGKSTLLKVLSRIVEPTEGEITMRGRVASLLEVGTGFHPELTGRENVYFNGAILGMSQKEIKSKFDEIVAFSEVEKFLDTPVKFYSSGMYVRLAFAVAAHLEPDILIVDEVLAVGDAAFQKKCLGKMKDVAGQGRTVLFVSHSMDAIRNLCNKGILMDEGRVASSGHLIDIIDNYRESISLKTKSVYEYGAVAHKKAQIRKITILDSRGKQSSDLDMDKPWIIQLEYSVKEDLPGALVLLQFITAEGMTVYATANSDRLPRIRGAKKGKNIVDVKMDKNLLTPGIYTIDATIQSPGSELFDRVQDPTIEILPNQSDIRSTYFSGRYFGHNAQTVEWEPIQPKGQT